MSLYYWCLCKDLDYQCNYQKPQKGVDTATVEKHMEQFTQVIEDCHEIVMIHNNGT